jgi:hypothetical protein
MVYFMLVLPSYPEGTLVFNFKLDHFFGSLTFLRIPILIYVVN